MRREKKTLPDFLICFTSLQLVQNEIFPGRKESMKTSDHQKKNENKAYFLLWTENLYPLKILVWLEALILNLIVFGVGFLGIIRRR